MASHVLFVQGGGEGVHDEWDSKLVDGLRRELGSGYDVKYPRMPIEADPRYVPWKAALTNEFAMLDDGAIVIGHSVGGTVLINALATDPPELALKGIFLIAAPFVGDGGWPSDEFKSSGQGLGAELPKGVPIYLYHGDNDESVPIAHLDLYARAIPHAVVRRLDGRNHQLDDDMSEVARDVRSLS